MHNVLWTGRLYNGKEVEIRKINGTESHQIVMEAHTTEGKIAQRTANRRWDGTYDLTKQYGTKYQAKHRGQGIASRLIALMLKEITERNGSQVILGDVANERWRKHLIENLGARAVEDPLSLKLEWKKEQLTLKPHQAWHDFLN